MLSRVTGKNCTFPSFHPFNIKWWAAKIGSDFKDCDVLQVTEWLFYFTYWIRAGYQSATKEPQVFTKKGGLTSVERGAQRQITSGKSEHLFSAVNFQPFDSLAAVPPCLLRRDGGSSKRTLLSQGPPPPPQQSPPPKKKSQRIIWVKAAL